MQMILFLVWWMVAILPFFIFMEGYGWFKKYMAKRGVEITWVHATLIALVILFIVLWLYGYRLQ